LCLLCQQGFAAQDAGNLLVHFSQPKITAQPHHVEAEWSGSESDPVLRMTLSDANLEKYSWLILPAPGNGWDLSAYKTLDADIANCSDVPMEVYLWAVGKQGWGAVCDTATLAPGENRDFKCDLRRTFRDGTPIINPTEIAAVQIMVKRNKDDAGGILEVSSLKATGQGREWKAPVDRLSVPDMTDDVPKAGRRVRFQLPGDEGTDIYCALYLPPGWKKGEGAYPVIAEYPGNIYFTKRCYSTGLPDQCRIGYGMSEGQAIWVSLPFIGRAEGTVITSGFGNPDDTAAYAQKVVQEICSRFGGDPDYVILTGFSRGSIACGYIGLRNDEISKLWKGIHGCQHYDGSNWRESNMPDAVERAARFQGKAIFQTDNSKEKYQPVVDATDPAVVWTWVSSGLGAHDTAMFLDDRPSTLKLRKWYNELTSK